MAGIGPQTFVGLSFEKISPVQISTHRTFSIPKSPQLSKEGDSFPVPVAIAKMSELVNSMMTEDDDETNEIPLPDVKASILQKIIEFCTQYKSKPMNKIIKPFQSNIMSEVVQTWYAEFVNVEQPVLFELMMAAHYMDIKPLYGLTCAKVAIMLKGKSQEEIRRTFNIKG